MKEVRKSFVRDRLLPCLLAGVACALVLIIVRLLRPHSMMPEMSRMIKEVLVFFGLTSILSLACLPLIEKRAFYLVPLLWGFTAGIASLAIGFMSEARILGQAWWTSSMVSFGIYFLLGILATAAIMFAMHYLANHPEFASRAGRTGNKTKLSPRR